MSSLSLLGLMLPSMAHACATCYGRSDSELAKGMNWGIFVLLLVILLVLGGVATFFVFLAKRASWAGPSAFATEPLTDSSTPPSP